MLEVYDRALRKRAVLSLAYDRVETEVLNGVGQLAFCLPADDPKAARIAPFSFVRNGAQGAFYRVLQSGMETGATGERRYTCEHAIATLVDDVMFGTHIIGGSGYSTRRVLETILAGQTVGHWRLGRCEFDKQFEYGLESENLLNALLSVPNLFVEKYRWDFDFSTYPFVASLLMVPEGGTPDFYIRAGRNLIAEKSQHSGVDVCTRLYLLGYGEGDNQLRISDVNGGKPYLESPQQYIDRYGLISKVYVDRQFEDAASLMERGRALLSVMQDPPATRTFDVVDLYEISDREIDHAEAGDRVRMTADESEAFITQVIRYLDRPGDVRIEMSTKAGNIAADIADIADRQRIEQVYSQGATQIYAQSIQANADKSTQAVLSFFIPKEMRIVNRVAAKIAIEPFRSYNRVTSGGGGSTATSASGGGGSQTSASGGGFTVTSGPSSLTTTSMSDLRSGYNYPESTTTAGAGIGTGAASGTTGSTAVGTSNASAGSTGVASGSGAHTHSISHTHTVSSHAHALGSHTHQMGSHSHGMIHTHGIGHSHSIAHTHSISAPSHTHSVSVPSHSHSVSVPEHSHNIVQGIFRFGNPTGAGIYVNGTHKFDMEKEREVDLTEHLASGNGKIPRGSWIRLGVLPNDLSYVTIDIYIQGFVQSRGGGSY